MPVAISQDRFRGTRLFATNKWLTSIFALPLFSSSRTITNYFDVMFIVRLAFTLLSCALWKRMPGKTGHKDIKHRSNERFCCSQFIIRLMFCGFTLFFSAISKSGSGWRGTESPGYLGKRNM